MTWGCLDRSGTLSDICTEVKLQQLLEQKQQLQQLLERQIQQQKHFVKLPELVISTFDGNKLQWREFWDLFQITVDQNEQLSEIEKICYLKRRLTGVAKQVISGIFISTENYVIAKQLLDDRFNDKEFVLCHNLREVMNLTPAHNNPSSLRKHFLKVFSFFSVAVILLIGSNDFSFQFRKIITLYRRIGYNLNVMRQSACLVFNPIIVDNYAALFNCTPVGRASDSMMAPT